MGLSTSAGQSHLIKCDSCEHTHIYAAGSVWSCPWCVPAFGKSLNVPGVMGYEMKCRGEAREESTALPTKTHVWEIIFLHTYALSKITT